MQRLLALAAAFSSVGATALAAAAPEHAPRPAAALATSLGLPTLVAFLLILLLAAALGPGVARQAPPHPKDLDQH